MLRNKKKSLYFSKALLHIYDDEGNRLATIEKPINVLAIAGDTIDLNWKIKVK